MRRPSKFPKDLEAECRWSHHLVSFFIQNACCLRLDVMMQLSVGEHLTGADIVLRIRRQLYNTKYGRKCLKHLRVNNFIYCLDLARALKKKHGPRQSSPLPKQLHGEAYYYFTKKNKHRKTLEKKRKMKNQRRVWLLLCFVFPDQVTRASILVSGSRARGSCGFQVLQTEWRVSGWLVVNLSDYLKVFMIVWSCSGRFL